MKKNQVSIISENIIKFKRKTKKRNQKNLKKKIMDISG